LKAILRKEEESPGEGWTSPLGKRLANALGGTEWDVVRAFVYGGDRGRIGQLARAVADAAEADDFLSLHILRDAGKELARLANSLAKRVGPRPIALVGGGTRLHPIIAAAFRAELQVPVDVISNDVDAAMTAARLAAMVE
jgi:N-acetylglucosamine kinase-like BadF-type ATPase